MPTPLKFPGIKPRLVEIPSGSRARLREIGPDEAIPAGAYCSIGHEPRVKDISPSSAGKTPSDFTGWSFFVKAKKGVDY